MRKRWACAGAGVLSFFMLFASSASAQFVCTTTPTDIACNNSETAPTLFVSTAAGTNQNDTVNNSGTANGFASNALTGNATATNSGSNTGDINVSTITGNATAINSGSNGGIFAESNIGNVAVANSGSNTGAIQATIIGAGNTTVTNSGSNTGGIVVQITAGNATVSNSGSNTGGITVTSGNGNATVTNSGSNTGGIGVSGQGNATIVNSGRNTGLLSVSATDAMVINSGSTMGGIVAEIGSTGNATVINSGTANGGIDIFGLAGGNATLTNIVGGRVIGLITLQSNNNTVNFQGGNWLFTIATTGPLTFLGGIAAAGSATINAGGAPFVILSATDPTTKITTNQVAVLDPTTFALADRSLMNFTGEISQMLQGHFGGLTAGNGGSGALGFAPPSNSRVADQAQAAFSGIPSVAMSYASDARPVLGKTAAGVPYYDTTVWASGFGGERKQHADGDILPTTDTAFGGAMGVDRIVNSNLRLGAFVGAGASREAVELNVQTIDATYVFGGAYGRFDWATQYLDFSLYGGGIDNKSTRQVANNIAASGLETATASYGGWFISPELTYGYRIPFNAVTVTPRLRLRYVGGELDGYSESGSMQNLSVGGRAINDVEERGEVEFSTVSGAFKGAVTVGVIGLERLGNPTINTVLLSQSLSFTTPGQASAVGGALGMRMEYRAKSNVAFFVAGEGTAMSDRSDSFAATGGARVSF